MTVHTPLSNDEVADLLMMYDVGALERLETARGRSVNTNYVVSTAQGRFLLRVHEGKTFREMVYERELLHFLSQIDLGVQTPEVIPNVIHGHFTPIEEGKYASLFSYLDGRTLADWEVTADHCTQVGEFLARLHLRGRGFRGQRRHPYRPARIFAMLDHIRAPPAAARRFVTLARRERRALAPKLARRVQHSVIHGGLAPAETRFAHGKLRGVIDFETGARGPMVFDLGVALNAWGWTGEHSYAAERCQALLGAYQTERALGREERRQLFSWTRYAALRFAITRLVRCELSGAAERDGDERYRDYRHFERRLEALREMGRRDFDLVCALSR